MLDKANADKPTIGSIPIDYDYETHPVDTAVSEDIAVLVGVGLDF